MNENNIKNLPDSQENLVPLQQKNIKANSYGTDDYSRAEASASEGHAEERSERLGLRAVAERGRPTLADRWDTFVYEEGLWPDDFGDQLGNKKPSAREESDRLIAVAKFAGDYIPSTIWETFGDKVNIPSAESVVFTDERNGRVIKVKDPFVTANVFGKPSDALYQHHIHNRFFDNVPYRLLGMSQDPNYGGVRFIFEQPFVNTCTPPSNDEIKNWFKKRGFRQTDDSFFFTDGYVSFADLLDNDNCLKDKDGNLYFIDPMVKLNKSPKEVIEHYLQRDQELQKKLDDAGIKVGSRFRIEHLCSFNDLKIKDINLAHNLITFSHTTSHADYQYDCEWPIERVLDNIKLSQGSRWIMVDDSRNDIVIPQARQAIIDRVNDLSRDRCFTDEQVNALRRYTTLFSEKSSKEEIYGELVDSLKAFFQKESIPEQWVDEVREELRDLAHEKNWSVETGIRI